MTTRRAARVERRATWHSSRLQEARTPRDRLAAASAALQAEAAAGEVGQADIEAATDAILALVNGWRAAQRNAQEGQAA
ncbi:MAG: hypothetical protein V4597_19295 [Pseudomonadota bacterium]